MLTRRGLRVERLIVPWRRPAIKIKEMGIAKEKGPQHCTLWVCELDLLPRTMPARQKLSPNHSHSKIHPALCPGEIPEAIRNRITEVTATNLRSATPLPLVLKVGDNVDATHELLVKTFAHDGHIYIGLHMLCPNPALK